MNKPLLCRRVFAALGMEIKSIAAARLTSGMALLGLLLLALVTPASAQETVGISTTPVRTTVPLNYSGTNVVTVQINIGGGSNEVDLSLAGLPAGATATLSKTAFTNNSSSTMIFYLTNVAEGIYWLTLTANNNANNFYYFPLQVGDVWSGGGGANKNWSSSANWNGGVVPGLNDDVIFNQGGAQNVTNTNSVVDITTTIASLRFALTNSSTNVQSILINPGVTLNITGTNSLQELRDWINLGNAMNVIITGQGGSLNVANENGNFALLTDGNVKSVLDMHTLGNLNADVNRFTVGDQNAYPNFTNITANATGGAIGRPKQYQPTLSLPLTNIIKAVYADPNNYNNSSQRLYSLELGNNGNQATGSGTPLFIQMGVSNLFLLDSVCIAGFGGTSSTFNFNTNDVGINPNPSAYFRNTDGVSRLSMFALADAATTFTNAGGNTKASGAGVDFGPGHGYVDALVDRFIMARDAPVSINGGCTAQSTMSLGAGIFDANTAILGDQTSGDQPQINYCQATLSVSNTAVFKANVDMELGWTTSDLNDKSLPGDTFGQLNVGPGGTVMVNKIGVGGTTKTSGEIGANGSNFDSNGKQNQINLSSGSLLIVSNTIADATPNGAVGVLNMSGNATLELFIDGSISRTNVYAATLTTSGSGNTIKIGGISNLTTPAQVPLIQYAAGTPTYALSLPAGYSGAIINNGAGKTIDAFITVGAPKSLAWRSYVNNTWDTTTKNWLDLNTGLQTNFANLDIVSFDDTPGVSNLVSLSGLLIPGAVNMTNSVNNYTLNGGGTTSGSAVLNKGGTGSLDVEDTTTLSINLNQGTLTGGGAVNSVAIASGATMVYSGTIGAGIICSGSAILANSAYATGTLDVKGGGLFTNTVNATVDGPITLETNSFLNNQGTIVDMFPSGSVATNAFLLNSGNIYDGGTAASEGTLTINGTLEDTGAGGLTLFRLTLGATCTFIPGNNGIGLTTISSDGVSGSGLFPGRLSMGAGSKTLIYVNGNTSTKVNCNFVDYGPSQTPQSENGCTFVISNLGASYVAGQVFQIVGNDAGGGDPNPDGTSTNSFPIISPEQPGPGLAWDLSQLWPHGQIGVIHPPNVILTNLVTRTPTNIISILNWPSSQKGWVLEQQQNPLSIGLYTNWTRITGSQTNLSAGFTNSLTSTNPAVYYRLVFP